MKWVRDWPCPKPAIHPFENIVNEAFGQAELSLLAKGKTRVFFDVHSSSSMEIYYALVMCQKSLSLILTLGCISGTRSATCRLYTLCYFVPFRQFLLYEVTRIFGIKIIKKLLLLCVD